MPNANYLNGKGPKIGSGTEARHIGTSSCAWTSVVVVVVVTSIRTYESHLPTLKIIRR